MDAQRRHVSGMVVGEKNRAAQLVDPALVKLAKKLIEQLEKQIAQIDELIKAAIADSPGLRDKAQKLSSVRGESERAPRRCSWRRCRSWVA